jgi:pyridoxamine 5'-phosphate oxidase
MQSLAELRKEYSKSSLDVTTVDVSPITQFEKWFKEAIESNVQEPNAMNLATVNEQGRPSSRIVLLKGIENSRFQFYTNYQSKKGKELDLNPACALTFFWPELERQVRIEGVCARVLPEVSDRYFQSRPRGSQIGAWSSPQSTLIKDRLILDQRVQEIEKKFEGNEILPRPKQWGGYEVDALMIEFWQGRQSRLHDRVQYSKIDDRWQIYRLAP